MQMALSLPSREAFMQHGLKSIPEAELANHTDEQACPICHCDFDRPVKTPCGHVYCDECIRPWLETNERCPTCRTMLIEPPAPAQALEIGTDVEPLYLGFEVNQAAVVRELNSFNDYMDVAPGEELAKFTWPDGSKVHLDITSLLPRTVAVALWLKPDVDGGRRTDFCRYEWESAIQRIHLELEAKHGLIMDATAFRDKLAMDVNAYVSWSSYAESLPDYSEDVELSAGRTLTSDLSVLYDYITWCGVREHEKRTALDISALGNAA